MEQSPSWEANSHSASQKIPHLLWTRRFVTVFTKARHCFISWARCSKSTPPYPVSLRSILILSSHLRLRLPSGLFPANTDMIRWFHPKDGGSKVLRNVGILILLCVGSNPEDHDLNLHLHKNLKCRKWSAFDVLAEANRNWPPSPEWVISSD
jgi:hypothetical protein